LVNISRKAPGTLGNGRHRICEEKEDLKKSKRQSSKKNLEWRGEGLLQTRRGSREGTRARGVKGVGGGGERGERLRGDWEGRGRWSCSLRGKDVFSEGAALNGRLM